MRKLASIRRIESISPIENADAIDVAAIGGWNVVVKKGEHQVGDLVVYFEIDSWIPEHYAPFLGNERPAREYEGVMGFRLKSKKLRGVVSQGLILPLSAFNGTEVTLDEHKYFFEDVMWNEDEDVSECLNVKKYDPPVSANLAGVARGNFPGFIRKTDQERIQNLKRDLADWIAAGLSFEVTEKLDGTSCTIYKNSDLLNYDKEPLGVCSRNLDLKETEGNTYWNMARTNDIHASLLRDGRNLAVQGEVIGEGIQGNKYKLSGHHFYVFDIYDIDNRKYLSADERMAFCKANNLKVAPVIHKSLIINENTSIADLLIMAEGDSILYKTQREGLVFKCLEDTSISFKAISNKWLLKHEE